MDAALITALGNLGGMGLLSAALFILLMRQMALFDKHMTSLVKRLGSLESEVQVVKVELNGVCKAFQPPSEKKP